MGGPAPIGAQKANLSDAVEPYMQEIGLSEQVCPCTVFFVLQQCFQDITSWLIQVTQALLEQP